MNEFTLVLGLSALLISIAITLLLLVPPMCWVICRLGRVIRWSSELLLDVCMAGMDGLDSWWTFWLSRR